MMYPTLEQVNVASHEQICRWWRFLESPGTSAIGTADFENVMFSDAAIMKRIGERIEELGGFTPEISKKIGW